MKFIQKSKNIYTRLGNSEAIQMNVIISFLQAPNSNRLWLFAELYVCSYCGHLILLRKEDGKFFHVTVDEVFLGEDPQDNQDHWLDKFILEKQCAVAIGGVEIGDDPLNDTVFTCICDNPEPLGMSGATLIIDGFGLMDPTKLVGNIINYDIYEMLPHRPPYERMRPDGMDDYSSPDKEEGNR